MWRGNLRQVACQLAPAVPRGPESARVRDRPDLLRQVRGAAMLTNPHSCQRFQTCWTRHFKHANCKLPSRQRSLGLTQVRRSRSIADPAGAGLQTLSFIHCGSSSSLGIFWWLWCLRAQKHFVFPTASLNKLKRETKNRFFMGAKEGRCAYVPGMQRVAPLLSQQPFLDLPGKADENQARKIRKGEKPGQGAARTTPCGRPWSRGPPRSGS